MPERLDHHRVGLPSGQAFDRHDHQCGFLWKFQVGQIGHPPLEGDRVLQAILLHVTGEPEDLQEVRLARRIGSDDDVQWTEVYIEFFEALEVVDLDILDGHGSVAAAQLYTSPPRYNRRQILSAYERPPAGRDVSG